MLYNYIKTHYKQAEPIFLSDLLRTNISDDGEVLIGNRRFYIRKPIVPITKENVYILQKPMGTGKMDFSIANMDKA